MKKILITIITVLALTITSSAQTNYYVSPSGDDNNSGLLPSQAWLTIQKAADELQAGDTVFIKSGTYHEIVIPANSGTPNNYITYTAYPGDTAIIDGTNFASTYLQYFDRGIFDIKTKCYINVIGLFIQNSAATGITSRYGSSNINIINNHVTNCQGPGIAMGYSRLNYPMATNIIASGNYVENCSQISREAISFRSVDTFAIFDNKVINTPKEGIDAKSGCMNGNIYNNFVSNVGAVGIYIDAGYPDVLYTSSHNIHVYKNTLENCGSSIAVASEAGCPGENIWIYNNVIYDTSPQSGDGIIVANYGESGPLQDIHIINNTIVGKGHRGIYINNLDVRDIYIRNNICAYNSISQIDVKSSLIDSVILEYNLIYGTNVDDGDFAVIGDPAFIDLYGHDFHLSAGSPAIDNGTSVDAPGIDFDGVIRPSGAGYDIGAYEYPAITSIFDLNKKNNISCYPNPTKNIFFIECDDILLIKIINRIGQLVKHIEVDNEITAVNLSNETKGVYFVKIVTNKETTVKKIILQ